MDFLAVTVIVVVISLISIVVDRRWQARQQTANASAEELRPSFTTRVTEGFRSRMPRLTREIEADNAAVKEAGAGFAARVAEGFRNYMPWRKQPEAQQKFRTWLTDALTDPSEKAWLQALSDDEFAIFSEQLADFCSELGIDPTWLGEPSLTKDFELEQVVKDVVLNFYRARRQAVLVQQDLKAFKIYLAIEERPYSREHQSTIQQLYSRLVSEGLASAVPPGVLMATEKIRQQHMLKAIQTAADKDRKAFNLVLKAIVNDPTPELSTTPAPTTSTPITTTPTTTTAPVGEAAMA
jgi:hypothetical protein